MNKKTVILSIVGILIISALALPSARSFFATLPAVNLTPGDEVTVRCSPGSSISGNPSARRLVCPTLTASIVPPSATLTHGAGLTATKTVTITVAPTKTLTPPVISLTPSKTATATKSPTPGTGNIVPFRTAPECLDGDMDMHGDVTDSLLYGLVGDTNLYHDLWNEKAGCHYNHTHNADPALANAVFGPVGAAWGQEVSYPFPTSNENNFMGHPGYKFEVDVRANAPVPQESFEYLNPDPNYVTAFRIEYHDAGGNAHMVKRFHSYYVEARILSLNGDVTGTIATGGWADYGCLHGSYKQFFTLLPGIDPVNASGQSVCGTTQTIDNSPLRSTRTQADAADRNNTNDNVFTWSTDSEYGYNQILKQLAFRTLDSWGWMDPNDPYTERFICPSFNCKFNSSVHDVYTLWFNIPDSMDSLDGVIDGKVTYTGYTDVKGNIVQGCTAPGANCVPLKIINVPVGNAIINEDDTPRTPGVTICDHDIYFNKDGSYAGQLCNVIDPSNYIQSGWIEFPN